MGLALMEDTLDRSCKRGSVDVFELPNKEKIKISRTRRAATLVGSRVRVQFLRTCRSSGTSRMSIGPRPNSASSPGRYAG